MQGVADVAEVEEWLDVLAWLKVEVQPVGVAAVEVFAGPPAAVDVGVVVPVFLS